MGSDGDAGGAGGAKQEGTLTPSGWTRSASDGDKGSGTNGGNGGTATASRTGDDMSYDSISVTGGGGGNSDGAQAGKGGDATLNVSGILSVNIGLYLQSGASGTGALPGTGGNVSFNAGTLVAPAVGLTKQDGNLAFTLGTLDVTQCDTRLFLDGADVHIGTARLDGYRTLEIGSGAATIDLLILEGGGSFTDSGSATTVGSLSIDGGTINSGNFNLINTVSYANSDITLGSGGAKFDTTGGDQSVSRALIGTGGLTKIGTNMLTLTGI
jgi:hypothetical protein